LIASVSLDVSIVNVTLEEAVERGKETRRCGMERERFIFSEWRIPW